jgi:hypothetical protein
MAGREQAPKARRSDVLKRRGGGVMQNTRVRQPLNSDTWFSDKTRDVVPRAPWRSALFILGIAAALIIIGAVCPEFFAGGGISQFGPESP